MRVLGQIATCGFLSLTLCVSGCGGGALLGGLGIDSLGDDDDSGSDEVPPSVTTFEATPDPDTGSRDRIHVEFTLSSDGRGVLSAKVEFVEMVNGQAVGDPRPVTLLPGSDSLEDIPSDRSVQVIWDAKHSFFLLSGGRDGLDTIEFELGGNPRWPANGDFDGDGFSDVAIPDSDSHSVFVLWNNHGELEPGPSLPVGNSPGKAISADFNRDGLDDIAVINMGTSDSVTFLAGSADALVPPGREIDVGPGQPDFDGTTGDFDADGFVDLVVPNDGGNRAPFFSVVTLLRGSREGLRRVDPQVETGLAPEKAIAMDIDGDGLEEVVVAHGQDTHVTLLKAETGRLVIGEHLPLGPIPLIRSGDFAGDGQADLVVESALRELTVLAGGRGSLVLSEPRITFPAAIRDLVSGDFNGDDIVDLVTVTQNSVAFLAGTAAGLTRTVDLIPVGDDLSELAIGDFNADGVLDLVVTNEDTDRVVLLTGGESGPELAGETPVGPRSGRLEAGDFDGDGQLDLAVLDSHSDSVGVFLIRGQSTGLSPDAEPISGGEQRPTLSVVADFDGDGRLDLVTAWTVRTTNNLSFYRGDAETGLIHVEPGIQLEARPREMTSGDYDGDGFPDLAVLDRSPGNISLVRGGPGGLGPGESVPCGPSPKSMIDGDFDGDGFLDLAVANLSGSQVTVIRGHPGGLSRVFDAEDAVLDESVVFDVGQVPNLLHTADVTGDGFADIVVANQGGLTLLRQQYLSPHRNERIDPAELVDEAPPEIIDRRSPPRFNLELPREPFDAPTQVAIVLTTVFDLPQGEAHKEGKYYTVVTQPVAIMRETTEIDGTAMLTLLLREYDRELATEVTEHRERLRVFRKDPATGRGVREELAPSAIELEELVGPRKGTGIRFPIRRFGSYLVALERDR